MSLTDYIITCRALDNIVLGKLYVVDTHTHTQSRPHKQKQLAVTRDHPTTGTRCIGIRRYSGSLLGVGCIGGETGFADFTITRQVCIHRTLCTIITCTIITS